MSPFDPHAYGPVFETLLAGIDRNRPLDRGRPGRATRAPLDGLSIDAAFAHAIVRDADMARCCLAGAWLLYDELNESHAVSQEVETPEGSYWHGVMHRREGDFSNAKYWFRRVGRHQVFGQLGAAIVEELNSPEGVAPMPAAALVASVAPTGEFDPFAFTDACQSALRVRGPAEERCREVQRLEWDLLFDYCYRTATAPRGAG